MCSLYSHAIIVRKDRAGREGKAAAISDLPEETGLSESSCYLMDDTAEVLDKVSSYLPQVSCAQIKFPRKPAVQSADIPQRKWFVDKTG